MNIGNLLILFYILLSACKAVFLSHLLKEMNPIVVLFYTFLITWLIFLLIAIFQGRIRFLARFTMKHWKSIFWFNLFTAGNWVAFFIAVKCLEPSAHAVIANTTQPLLTLLLPGISTATMATELRSIKNKTLYLSGLFFIGAGVCLQVAVLLLRRSSLQQISLPQVLWGMSMSLLCAISLTLNRKVNYQLQSQGLNSKDLMCVRFLGLLLFTAMISNQDLGFTIPSVTLLAHHGWQIALVGIFGVTIPIYLLQKGQTLTDEFSAALMLSLMPVSILMIQLIDSQFSFSLGSTIATILATCGSTCVLVTKNKSFSKSVSSK